MISFGDRESTAAAPASVVVDSDQVLAGSNVESEDVKEGLRKSFPTEVALANAPDADGTFFKVPKVIER